MFVQVIKELAGDTPLPSSPYSPWRFGNPLQLLQDLKEANFSNVECTSYSHAMTFTLPDLIAFQLGPHGQSRPTLEKLKALGRDDIDEEAQKVCMQNECPVKGITLGILCRAFVRTCQHVWLICKKVWLVLPLATQLLWRAVLCCAVLCCAVLCCAVLCCAVLCCAVLCSSLALMPHALCHACCAIYGCSA